MAETDDEQTADDADTDPDEPMTTALSEQMDGQGRHDSGGDVPAAGAGSVYVGAHGDDSTDEDEPPPAVRLPSPPSAAVGDLAPFFRTTSLFVEVMKACQGIDISSETTTQASGRLTATSARKSAARSAYTVRKTVGLSHITSPHLRTRNSPVETVDPL